MDEKTTDTVREMDERRFDLLMTPAPSLRCHGGCSGSTHAGDCDLAGTLRFPDRLQRSIDADSDWG